MLTTQAQASRGANKTHKYQKRCFTCKRIGHIAKDCTNVHRLETLFGVKKVDGDIGKKKNRASRKERTKAKKKEQDTKIDALRNLLIRQFVARRDQT